MEIPRETGIRYAMVHHAYGTKGGTLPIFMPTVVQLGSKLLC